MGAWGVNQKSNQNAAAPLSQANPSSPSRSESEPAKRWKISVALLAAGSLALVVGGNFHSWRKAAPLNLAGTAPAASKGEIGKFAERLLKGSSLFRGARANATNELEAAKATKMSGTSLSLPLFFEANRGQTNERVKFLARSSGYTLFVTPTETVFAGALTTAPRGMSPPAEAAADKGPGPGMLRMKLLASNPGSEISGAKELPGKVNYLIGNDPRNWHTGVPLYEEVRSREVYPGIDLVFHGDQQRLEYDFRVSPGADPGRIRFKITGAEKIAVDENGDLLLHAAKTEFRMRKPVLYQQIGERRRPVDGGFSLEAGKLVAFHVGAYDKKLPLVIDPTIIFASFLGGAGTEVPSGQDLDVTNPSAPKLYVSGATTDVTSFSETSTSLEIAPGAGAYGFVAKIDPTTTGSASLDFLTFIGGSLVFTGGTAPCQNLATDMKLDVSGGAGQVEPVLLGQTNCRDFPVTTGGPTTGTDDLFITRLTPNGAGIDGSTLFGGNGSEGLTFGGGASLFVNPEGTIVLSGQTTSTDFATTSNAYSVSLNNGTPGGFDDCFIANLNRSFNVLYLTYVNVGGNTTSGIAATCGVGAVDPAGKIYFGGTIVSATAFNLANGGTGANGFQKTFVGTPGTTPNAFVAVLDPSQSGLNQLTYSTYIAGGGATVVRAGAVDVAHSMAVVVGDTFSNSTTNAPDIPLLNAIQATNNSPAGAGTGFITVIDTTKTGVPSLAASSYFGGSTGSGSTSLRSVAIDAVAGNPPTQRIVVGGQTTATNFPMMNPLQASLVGSQNAVVSVLSVPSPGSTFNMSLLFSTYLGGGVTISGQSESVRGLIADSNHQIYAVGRTPSANFFGNTSPATTVNGFQTTCASCGGGTPADDIVIFVLTPQSGTSVPDLTVTKSHSGNFSQGQSGAQFSITVTNSGTGATVGTVSLADSLPSSLTATAMTGAGWSCSISTLVCTRSDALAGGASYPVITLTVNVAGSAPPSVTNTVVVSGGSETNTANDTASDTATVTSSVGACTDNYTGPSTGAYGTPTNWSTGSVPGIADVACIPSGITVFLNTSLPAANQTISALNNLGILNISAGPLTVTNNSVANSIVVNGGTLAFNGQLTVSGPFSVIAGTFAGTGEVDLNGAFTWSGGTMSGASVTNANGGMSIPNSVVILDTRTLNVSGTTTFGNATSGSDLFLLNGAVVNNKAGAIWNIVNGSTGLGNGIIYNGGALPTFNNAGTFEMTGGTSDTVNVIFNNTGTVTANAGTQLTFSGGGICGGTCAGAWTAGTGSTLNFAGGTFALSGSITGAGTVNFSGGTENLTGTYNIPGGTTVNGGTANFTGTLTSAGALTVSSGTANFSNVGGIVSTSALTLSGGTLTGSSNLTVSGLLNWSGSGTMSGTGITNANGGMSIPNAVAILDTRTLNVSGTTTFGNATGGSDLFLINGAVVNNKAGAIWNIVNGSTGLGNGIIYNGGTLPTFNNAGTFEMTGGTSDTVNVIFNNTGTVTANAGTQLTFSGGGICGGSCSGAWTAGTGAALEFGGGTFALGGSITGAGTVNFSGGTENLTGTYNIPGGTTVNGGTANFTGTLTSAGALTVSSGTANFSNVGGIVSTSALTLSGGTLTGSSNLTVSGLLNWSGSGTMSGTGITNANGGMSIPNAVAILDTRTLNVSGTTTFGNATGGSDLFLINGAVVNNKAGAIWNIVNGSTGLGNGIIYNGGALPTFNNAGTFEMTGGTSDTVNVIFNNTGTVTANAGTQLTFSGGGICGGTCAGAWTAGTGSTLNFAGGTFALSGSITGAGTVNFSGGTENLTGTYNIPGGTTVSGGTANFTGTLTSAGALTVSSGTANFSNVGGIVSTSALTLSGGTLTGSSNLTVSGLLNWSGSGTMSGTGITNANGGMSIPNAVAILDTRTLNVSGTTTFGNATGGSDLFLINGAVVNNKAGAIWNIVNGSTGLGNGIIYNGGTLPTFNNAGTFEMTGGTSDTVNVIFNNTGTVTANAGTQLTFSGGGICGGSCSGAWTAGTGSTLNFAGGTFALSGSITGAGTVNFSGGTENLTGTYNIPGGTTVSGGTANFTGTLTSAGALTVSSGTANFSNVGGTVSTSTLTLSSGTLTGTSTVTVSGLLNWSGGTMSGTGITNANGGMSLPNPNSGVILDTRTLNVSGTTTLGSAAGGGYLFLMNGAVVNNQAGATWNIVNGNSGLSNGILNNGGAVPAFNNAGTFVMTGGASDIVSVIFNNTGTVAANAGTQLTFSGGGICAGTCAGTWTAGTGAALEFGGGTFALSGSIAGAGTVNFSGSTANLMGTYNIPGGTTVSGGTANFTGTLTSAGALTVNGGTANFSNLGGTVSTSTLTLSSGTLTGTSTVTVSGLLNWSGGTMSGTGITNANGGMSLLNPNGMILDTRTLNVSGTTTFGNTTFGSDLFLQNGAVVNNKAGAIWNIVNGLSNGIFNNGGAVPAFNNAGTFVMTGGTSDAVSVTFNNTGTVAAMAGTLSFGEAYTQTAGTTILNGGSIQAGTLLIQGGRLTGTGAVRGDVTNTGGSVAPGSATAVGSIAISGGVQGIYSQSSTGAYSVKIGGTAGGQFDTLTTSGATTLGGPLNVSLINSFSPALGNTFTILTAASVTGTFSTANLPALSTGLGWQVTYSATNVVLSVVTASSPIVNLSAGSLAFPNTIVNTSSAAQTVTLQNVGNASLLITSIQLTGTDAGNYTYTPDATNPCPISPNILANGSFCVLDVAFAPTSTGAHNNAQVTITDNNGGVSGSQQTISLNGTGIAPACIPNPPGLVSWWTGDGTTADLLGANPPSATNALSYVAGEVGQGFTFGTGGFIDIPASASLANQEFTWSAWVRPDGPGPNNDSYGSIILGQQINSSNVTAQLNWRATDNKFLFLFGDPNSEFFVSQDAFAPGQFYFVAGTYDGSTFKLYVNGVLEGQFAETKTIAYPATTWTIGSAAALVRALGFPRTWNGIIDEVQAFNAALTQAQIQAIYSADSSGECKTPQAGIVIAPSPVDFGNVATNAAQPVIVTINNTGGAALTINSITPSGAPFTVTNLPTLPAAIAPLGSATFNAVFTPTQAGAANGTITIASTASSSPWTIALTGTGTGATLQSIAVTPASPSIAKGLTQQFTATGTYSDNTQQNITSQVTWNSATPGVATISAAGLATGVGVGTSNITAGLSGVTSPIDVLTVTPAILQNIAVTPANPSVPKGLTQQFTATGMYSDGSLVDLTTQVTWNSATPGVATISATGLATGVGVGTSNITASLLGVTSPIDVLTVTAATLQTITVTPATPVVTPGNTVQYTATGHFSDGTTGVTSVSWTSSDTTIATVNATGLATSIKTGGPITITATSTTNAAISGTATLVVASPIGFVLTGSLNSARTLPTATLLTDGRVLVVGGDGLSSVLSIGELYNSATGTFTTTGSLTTARYAQTATLLVDGRVLIAGGAGANNAAGSELASAELFDPKTGTFTPTGSMTTARYGQTATLLNDGRVLITGGLNSSNTVLSSAEVFNPATGTFTAIGSMTTARIGHSATLLNDGTVLIAGGGSASAILGTAEIYDPNTETFTATGSLLTSRGNQTATLLDDGTVLITGGFDVNVSSLSSAELYNPATGTFTATGSMTVSRVFDTATLLNNGTVLLVGGYIYSQNSTFLVLPSAEIYDPIAKSFTATGSLNFARDDHSATLLLNGKLLVVGGDNVQFDGVTFSGTELASAELYTPNTLTQPGLTSISVTPATPSIPLGTFQRFTATGIFTGGGQQTLDSVTWSSSNAADVSITNDATNSGRAFALAPGSVTITACEGAICGSTDSTVPATLQSITVAPTSASVAAGLTQPFTATGHFSDGTTGVVSVNWTSSDTTIATINTSGVATGVKAGGPITITATSTTNGAISGTAQLTVTTAGPTLLSITVTPASPTLAKGGIETFIAIGHYSDASTQNLTSTVVWSSGTTSVATITAVGVATGVSGGTSTISATLGAVTGSTVLTVRATTTFAYVGNAVSANCCLAVLDTSTNQVVKTIPITNINEPFGITPDQNRVYIADSGNNIVNVVDTTTNTLVTTIPTGLSPTEVAITPDGKSGYVATFGETNVGVFSVATNAVVATVPTSAGFFPYWLTVTPDGASVYVTSTLGNTVAVINTKTNTVGSTFTIPAPAGQTSPSCLSSPIFNPAGTLVYILQQPSCSTTPATASGLVNVISIPSNTPVATIPVGVNPFGSIISPDGTRLYVVNNGSKSVPSNGVSVIDTASDTVIATVAVGLRPTSLDVTPDGALVYVTNSGANTLSIIQNSTNTVTSTVPLTGPFGIIFANPPAASGATTLSLTPPNLVFNAQVVGTQSVSQTIAVMNPGGSPVTLNSISLTGPNTGDFHLINGCPIPTATLGAGATCNLQISSMPTANGPLTALVTITGTNGIASSTQSAPLNGTGISLVSIAVTPASTSVTATNTVQFTATGTFSDNSTQDLTNSVNWSSSSTGIATINTSGLATGVVAGGPITITATSGNILGTAQLTVNPLVVTFPLNVTLIGTGTGMVTDNLGSINCLNTAGKVTGTCSASYPSGTVVLLTASPTQPSTFGGYLGACTGTGACSFMMNSAPSVTASFVPPPQAIPVPFTPGTNVSNMAAYDCPSNPNPSPGNPCLDPNAHATSLTIGQVLTPFTLTVVATEVPPTNGNGICENGLTPGQDLDCRFKSFFTFQTKPNGDTIVPLCYPYANGNCVVYSVFFQNPGQEPDPSMYVGPVNWNITFNNDTFVPPAPYTGSTPHLYYDPSGFVVPNSPYGTDCTTPMLIGNPGVATNPAIFCQFVFDITTVVDPTKKVDLLIGGKTKVFSDTVVAFPPVFAPVVTVTTTPDAATVTAGNPIGFTITVSNSAAAVANNVSLNTPLPGGTNVNWTISPAYTGPGTCAISGAIGSQVLNCAFGTLNQSTSVSLHILSASSAAGTAISPSTVLVGSQQLLSIGSIVVQPIPVTFSGLTASQSIPAGTSSVTLGGVIGNGTQFAPSGETVSISINGVTVPATVGSNGVFSLQFPTAGIPVSATPYSITYSYAGDSLLSAATDSSTSLMVIPLVTFPLNVTLIGTGTGMVTDNLGSINCLNTAGKVTGTCSASYPSGTVVLLTASPTQPSTFGGYLGACTGTGACSVTMNSAQSVTASFVPPPQAIPVPFTPGTNVSNMAAYDCPSNPNPSPGNPCLDPNAHATSLTIGQVLTPFTLTVVATEVPPTNGNGICENGLTPGQDLDCRFKSFFTFQTKPNGDTIVPLCYPYANGNCVVYSVFFQNPGQEPDPSMYVGPVNWNITFNNDTFVPPAPYTGSTPHLYYDPSGFVVPNSPYGTDCTTPMLIGNPGVATNPAIFCQFVFDITTVVDPTKKVDLLIGGKTKVFSDTVVAFPPVFAPVVTVTTTPDAATVTAGNPIGFTITVSNSAAAVANNVSLNTPLPGGTNVNWTISPAYTGPGTCAISGAIGSQVLNCAFGTLNQSTSVSLHILSASSAAGTAISPSTVLVGSQQLLSIGSIVVQPIPVTFSGLTASQSIPAGTSSVTLGGVIGNGTQFAPIGETVSITISGATVAATVGSNGVFSLQFPTAGIPVSATPYPITYSYAGDSLLSTATNNSTTLTVNAGGEPQLTAKTIGSGTTNGNFYEDVQIVNTGTGVTRNLTISSVTFKTLLGTGSVTLNTALSPGLPDNLGSFNVGATATVRLYLNVPVGVTRFLMSETGTVGDVTGKTFSFSSAQAVIF